MCIQNPEKLFCQKNYVLDVLQVSKYDASGCRTAKVASAAAFTFWKTTSFHPEES